MSLVFGPIIAGQEDTKHGGEDTPRKSGGLQRSPSVHDGA